MIFLVKRKTAYERRSSDWSSDVCSSDLTRRASAKRRREGRREACAYPGRALEIRSCRAKSRQPEGVRKRGASRLRSMRTGKGESVQTHIRERYSPNGRAPQSPSSAKRRQATRRCAGARAPQLPPLACRDPWRSSSYRAAYPPSEIGRAHV